MALSTILSLPFLITLWRNFISAYVLMNMFMQKPCQPKHNTGETIQNSSPSPGGVAPLGGGLIAPYNVSFSFFSFTFPVESCTA
jgi:hypothetical protein